MFFYKRIIIFQLIILVVLLINFWNAEKAYNQFPFNKEIVGKAKIVSTKIEAGKSYKYIVKINKNKFILYTKEELKYGDIIEFSGHFEKPKTYKNFGLSNYINYLKSQKIIGILRVEIISKIGEDKDAFFYLEILKNSLKQNLSKSFDKDKAGFLEGLLIGDKTNISEEIKEDFQDSGLSHILAISGMHVVYVSSGMEFILEKLVRKRRLECYIMILLLAFFAIFTGGSPSCLRACIMLAMCYIAELVFRKNNSYIALLVSFDIILLINCYNIFSIGFWLSFLSTFGIVYFNKTFSFKNSFLDSLKISIVSNLMIFPIICNCFNKISFTFLLSNICVSMVIGPIIIIGYIFLFFGNYLSFFAFIEDAILEFILFVAKTVGKFRISKIPFPNIPIYFCIIYYIVLLSVGYLLKYKEIWEKYKKQVFYTITILIVVRHYFYISQKWQFRNSFFRCASG